MGSFQTSLWIYRRRGGEGICWELMKASPHLCCASHRKRVTTTVSARVTSVSFESFLLSFAPSLYSLDFFHLVIWWCQNITTNPGSCFHFIAQLKARQVHLHPHSDRQAARQIQQQKKIGCFLIQTKRALHIFCLSPFSALFQTQIIPLVFTRPLVNFFSNTAI